MTPLHLIQRPNWIEIHLDALLGNLALIRSLVPTSTKILFPVKADAYGHGSLACSWVATKYGLVDFLGVAHLSEAILLRQYGIESPILVLGPCVQADYKFLREWKLIPTIADLDTARKLSELAGNYDPLPVHVKVNTGMHRYGFSCQDRSSLQEVLSLPGLRPQGIFSHMANSDILDHPLNLLQISRFNDLLNYLQELGIRPPLAHMANSGAVFNFPQTALEMIRPGIAIYGCNPAGTLPCPHPLVPVLRMKASIRQIHRVPRGESISYGSAWKANCDTLVASVAIGYGDGFSRGRPSEGQMFIRGKACPILGKVCMDTTMVDISALPEVQIGEPVDVINGEVDSSISLEAHAHRLGTISYELTCRVARRLYRRYHWQGRLLRWDDLRVELGVPEFRENPA